MSNTKIIIAGTTVSFVSPHKLEDLKKVSKYQPTALCLYNEDKVIDFAIFTGPGCVMDSSISYDAEAPDGSGCACVSVALPRCEGKNAKEAVAEVYGPAIVKANKVEDQVEAALNEVNAMLADVAENITIG